MSSTDWLTLALVAITAWYAWITRQILKTNESMVQAVRDQQYAAMRPYVQVTTAVRPGTSFIYLQVENIGKTAAEALTLSIDKDFYQLGEQDEQANLRKLAAFSQPIRSFAPGAKLRFLLGSGPSIFGGEIKRCPQEFEVVAAYSTGQTRVTEICAIDLRPYLRTETSADPVTEELKNLRETLSELKRIRQSLDRLQPDARTPPPIERNTYV